MELQTSASIEGANLRKSFVRRHATKLVASAVFTCLVVYTVHKGGLKLVPDIDDFAHVRWWAVGAYLVPLSVMAWFRSVRWRFLLRSIAEVPPRKLFAISCVGFAAILLLPFRLGEFVRPYMVRTPPRLRAGLSTRPITLTAATSSIVAERVIDGLYLSIVLALALFFVPTIDPLPDRVVGLPITVAHVRMSGYGMLGLFTVALATICVFYFARGWAHRTTLAVFGRVSMKLATRLASIAEHFADGLHVLGRSSDAAGFLFETTLYWLANALGMWLLAWGSGVVHADGSGPTLGEAFAMMGLLGAAVFVPAPPGLLGVFQFGVYAGMTMFYPTHVVTTAGAAYAFLLYATQFVFTVVTGALGLVAELAQLELLAGEDNVGGATAGSEMTAE
ncbi:MAG: flippase-like domain-containing protein [Polyangiaceae bacterium]|nr:flippase-like domain-containing protein [Polyangiaceae bacterium]